ncbi:histidine kinase [uncultured Nocardioides sp.]|uniref:sensor histidine kinase n=1 Tax=uncultured Nocardioides sp. TaxID=198441 RepID=UPI002632AC2E|nr:histidine kinase [uncultured Nocardioides sp.]
MTPPLAETSLTGPQLRTWRTTTAVRVFALALCTGMAISESAFALSFPMLVVLGSVAAATSTLDWSTRTHTSHWYAVAETVAVTALLVATDSTSQIAPYLAVPIVVAGVRHGPVTTVNVTLLSVLTAAAIFAVDPDDTWQRTLAGLVWLAIGLGVGLLASWQSRSIRDLSARQAPYADAHQLMERVHQLASSGSLGLDTTSLSTDLDRAMKAATRCARSTVFVLEPDGAPRALNGGKDVERLAKEIELPLSERTPGAAVIPLRGSQQLLGYCVLVGVPRWTAELDAAALHVADEFAMRLDTAVLFDEVRSLATSEERNRIAREMHDGVAQEIVGLGYLVDEIASTSDQEDTRELAAALRAEITRLVSEIRFSIFDLRHEVTDGRLTASLADYARGVSQASNLRLHLSLAESGNPLPPRTATQVLRVAQEAIGNVRKHAQAQNLWVTFRSDGEGLRLIVEDDGVGKAEPRELHWGLQTMRERAERVGAHLEVVSRPRGGTVVRLHSPAVRASGSEIAHGHQSAAG